MSPPPLVCAAALIFDSAGRLFMQRRSATRRLFPNCWDVVGGHVEPGETLEQTLAREIAEETGWQLAGIDHELPRLSWTGDDGRRRVEYDYLVRVTGDLDAPRLEAGRHTEFRWLAQDDLSGLLRREPSAGNELIEQLALLGYAARRATTASGSGPESGPRWPGPRWRGP